MDASAGFNVLRGGEKWSTDRSRRRLTRLWLDHIALTAAPAYEGAMVLDVRSANLGDRFDVAKAVHAAAAMNDVPASNPAATPTPRKDAVLARLASMGYDPAK